MNAPFLIFDLQSHTKSYDFDHKIFASLSNAIAQRIIDYDPEYGHYLMHHLIRTTRNLRDFMRFQGYDKDTIEKITHANKLHDCGKILQPISLHAHSDEKPTKEKKAERLKHRLLAKDVIEQEIHRQNVIINYDIDRHLDTILHIAEFHHERLNGSGPANLTAPQLDPIMRMITLVDEVDGKIKLEGKDLTGIFGEICGDKHAGMFDPVISEKYREFCRNNARYADISAIMSAPYPAA